MKSEIKIDYIDHMGSDISVVNSARVSFGKETKALDEKDIKLINYLAQHKHLTPFEHCTLTVKVTCPLFVRSQIHRHRTFCLAGDVEVTFNRPDKWAEGIQTKQSGNKNQKFTMEKIYKLWNKGYKDKIKKMLIRCYDEKSEIFTVSNIEDVTYSGLKDVFEIETKGGKKIKCSKDHLFLTVNGWQRLEDAVGLELTKNNKATMSKKCHLLVNGDLAWRNYDWMRNQIKKGHSVQEIANNAGCSYHNIRKWLKKHDLQFDNVEVLQKDIEKNGVWNKGKKGYNTDHTVTEEHKEIMRKAISGPNSNFWKEGVIDKRASIGRWTTEQDVKLHKKYSCTCQKCFRVGGKLESHHIMPVYEDELKAMDFNNLTSLCKSCHAKEHHKHGKKWRSKHRENTLVAKTDEIIKIKYCGKEDTYDLSIKGPNHNFIGNGIIVHNSYNEISRRYTSENIEFYEPEVYRKQHDKSKQCSAGDFDAEENETIKTMVSHHHMTSLALYEHLIKRGVAREMARGILPQNLMTEFWMTGNLRNWIHFLGLRIDAHAQKEVQSVAQPILKIIKNKFPESAKALFKYELGVDI